jgi:hypothetical protein
MGQLVKFLTLEDAEDSNDEGGDWDDEPVDPKNPNPSSKGRGKKRKKPQPGDDHFGFQPPLDKEKGRFLWLCDKNPSKPLTPSARIVAAKETILRWQAEAPDDKIIGRCPVGRRSISAQRRTEKEENEKKRPTDNSFQNVYYSFYTIHCCHQDHGPDSQTGGN